MVRRNMYEWDNLDSSISEDSINRLPELRLWKAVVANAIVDAMSMPTSKYCKMNKEKAVSWLLQDDNNFVKVCDFAGLSSGKIRTKLKPMLASKLR